MSSTVAGTTLSAYSGIDAIGDRLSTGVSGAYGYLVPDLHGNVVAIATSAGVWTTAYRYDAYGQTVDVCTGSITSLWRFQGRILESASGATDLYDFTARSYDPSLGAFTSFDSVSGSAQNPLTLNRYLYANANPATMIDPDGHMAAKHDGGSDAAKQDPGLCAASRGQSGCAPKTTTPKTPTPITPTKPTSLADALAGSPKVGGNIDCSASPSCLADHLWRSAVYSPIATINGIGDVANVCFKGVDWDQCMDAIDHTVNPQTVVNDLVARLAHDIETGNWTDVADVSGNIAGGVALGYFGAKFFGGIRGKLGGASKGAAADTATTATLADSADLVNLASPGRTAHILDGEVRPNGSFGGGHKYPGLPGKSTFPQGWSGQQIMHQVSDIATDPALKWEPAGSNMSVSGVRGGISIKVILKFQDGGWQIWTAYPTP